MTSDGSVGPGEQVGRSREEVLAETFVVLADTLVDDFDVVDLFDRLVRSCVNLLGVTAAGMLLDDQHGNLAVVASSSEESRLLEIFQLQNNEGPCLDCVTTSAVVTSVDLEADVQRWPTFVPAARGAGFRSLAAVPLRLRSQTLGGLNLFNATAAPLLPADLGLAQALADIAAIGILQHRLASQSSLLAEQLQHALDSRIVVEQAKGVLAERDGVAMDVAFALLRGYARRNNLKLAEVARAVVAGELDPS